MNAKTIRMWTVLGLSLLVLAAGCSKNNVPCDTDPSMLSDAQSELTSAQSELDSASSQLRNLQSQKSDLEGRMRNLPDTAELEEKLEDLKKGSGR